MTIRSEDRALELALPSVWATRHRLIDGAAYSFVGREFLTAIHDEAAAEMCVRKGNQVGVTEAVMNVALCDLDAGIDVMFVLPTEGVAVRHVNARVNGILRESAYVRAMFDASDNVRMKTCAGKTIYFEGSNSKSGAHSVPVGSLIIDELDRCLQGAIPEFEKRLTGHPSPRCRKISTPTYPGRGIDAEFLRSDQRFWIVACPHCGKSGTIQWTDTYISGFPEIAAAVRWNGYPEERFSDEDVRQSAAKSGRLECLGCGAHWSDQERKYAVSTGRWVASHPGRDMAGYHVPQTLSPVRPVPALVADYFRARQDEEVGARPGAMRTFFNGVLGMPYLAQTERVTREQCENLTFDGRVTGTLGAGADIGTWKHLAFGGIKDRVLYVEFREVKSLEEVESEIRGRGAVSAVVDAFPEKEGVERLCERMGGVTFRAYVPKDQLVPVVFDEPTRIVRLSRVSMVSAVLARIFAGNLRIVRNAHTERALDHLTRVTVVDDIDKLGDPVRRVLKLSPEDHFFWALVYLEAALRRLAPEMADLKIESESGTRERLREPSYVRAFGGMDRICGVPDYQDDADSMFDSGGFESW